MLAKQSLTEFLRTQVAYVADWASTKLWNWKSSFTSLLFKLSTCNFDIIHYNVFFFIVLYYLLYMYTLFFLWQTSACEKVIRRDIARTYPEHDFFREKDGLGQESLFNVMKVWSNLLSQIFIHVHWVVSDWLITANIFTVVLDTNGHNTITIKERHLSFGPHSSVKEWANYCNLLRRRPIYLPGTLVAQNNISSRLAFSSS